MIRSLLHSAPTLAAATVAALDLLRDHLEASLDHCSSIQSATLDLGASITSGANGRAILRQNRSVTSFITDLRARELAIALRLTQAGVVAERALSLSQTAAPIAALVKSGGTVLVEAGTRLASESQDGSPFAYLVSRGLIDRDATALPDRIASSDRFVILGAMPLSDVHAFLDAALRAIALQVD